MVRKLTLASVVLILVLSTLVGCGGGGGGSTSRINGTFTAMTTRVPVGKLCVSMHSDGTSVSGDAEILPADGAVAIVAPLTNAHLNSDDILTFTANLGGTLFVFSGTSQDSTVVGTLTIGNNPADSCTLSKVSDALAAPIAGTWNATFHWTMGLHNGETQTVAITITQPSGGHNYSGTSSSGNTTVTGTVFGNVIQWVIASPFGNAIGVGTVNNANSMSGQFTSTSTPGSGGTLTWSK